jgi:hypothetical protein
VLTMATTSGPFLEDAQLGVLEVMVMSAKGLKKRHPLGAMDPGVLVKVGVQEMSTQVHKKGGTDPIWNETVRFAINIENKIDLEVFDGEPSKPRKQHKIGNHIIGNDMIGNHITGNHMIGKCTMSLSKVRKEGKDGVEATVYCNERTPCGTISVKLTFTQSKVPKEGSIRDIAGVDGVTALAFNVGLNDHSSLPHDSSTSV